MGSVGPDDLEKERQLVARAQKDPSAFGAIFDLYYSKILNYALHRTGDAALAEDITAETFHKALRNMWRYRWQGVPFGAWLYRIAGNEIKMQARTRRHYSLELLMEAGFDRKDESVTAERAALEQILIEDAQFTFVAQALRELPHKYQEVVALTYMEGKSGREVAAIVGKKEGTVRSLLHRGMGMLKAQLEVQQNPAARITKSEGRGLLSILQNHL